MILMESFKSRQKMKVKDASIVGYIEKIEKTKGCLFFSNEGHLTLSKSRKVRKILCVP